jgi:WD40 repeat protein
VALSPDAALLAIGRDDFVEIVDVTAERPIRILRGHEGAVLDVTFSSDGILLATASADGTARLWDITTGTTRTTIRPHAGPLWGVAFSPDGTLLATASTHGTARLWDVADGTAHTTLIALSNGGYATLFAGGYKLAGDPGNNLWWAIKLCRFAPGELDPYVPYVRRGELDENVPHGRRLL